MKWVYLHPSPMVQSLRQVRNTPYRDSTLGKGGEVWSSHSDLARGSGGDGFSLPDSHCLLELHQNSWTAESKEQLVRTTEPLMLRGSSKSEKIEEGLAATARLVLHKRSKQIQKRWLLIQMLRSWQNSTSHAKKQGKDKIKKELK